MNKKQKKATGSFYTCTSIADYISNWVIDNKKGNILEPSFGDGSFIDSLNSIITNKKLDYKVIGVELQEEPYLTIKNRYPNLEIEKNDFMCFDKKDKIHAVVGNPPYVGLKRIDSVGLSHVYNRMKEYNYDISSSSSMWVPFIVHASELIENDGKIGFVLPLEMTYVRYSFKLWGYLKEKFNKLSIYRVYEDFFPDVDVETIIFLAEGKGGKTDHINYKVFNTLKDLFFDNFMINENIKISDVVENKKPFIFNLLSIKAKELFERINNQGLLVRLIDECKFNIGYVSGNKAFFHPTHEIVDEFKISNNNLIPCLLNSKDIRKLNMDLSMKYNKNCTKLFYPLNIDPGTTKYIKYGEIMGVNKGFKCKNRNPWYLTPEVEVPDLVLTVFGDVPTLFENEGCYVVSNSLLFGKVNNDAEAKNIICRWYNSLTLLLIELTIHSLGGGTLVLIPGETDMLQLLRKIDSKHVLKCFEMLNECYKQNGSKSTYELGDELVLKQIYGFSNDDIQIIKSSLEILQKWRQPYERRKK